nr:hypothetical protein CFP56_36567 [Quercus suber]
MRGLLIRNRPSQGQSGSDNRTLKRSAPLPFHGCKLLAHARLESNEENAGSRGPDKACDSSSPMVEVEDENVKDSNQVNKRFG